MAAENQLVECPFCEKEFPLPRRRHAPSNDKYGFNQTLCNITNKSGDLFAKKDEKVNCRVCLKRLEKK